MKTLLVIVRWALVIAGTCGAIVGAWAFIDPGAFPALLDTDTLVPPSPHWRALFLFLFSLLGIGFGTGLLRHRTLPRQPPR